jgi:hypothetical protein
MCGGRRLFGRRLFSCFCDGEMTGANKSCKLANRSAELANKRGKSANRIAKLANRQLAQYYY